MNFKLTQTVMAALAAACVVASCGAAAPARAATPSLTKQCRAHGNALGSMLALVQSAKTQAELDVALRLLNQLDGKLPGIAADVAEAYEQELTPAFVKKAYTEACEAGII